MKDIKLENIELNERVDRLTLDLEALGSEKDGIQHLLETSRAEIHAYKLKIEELKAEAEKL